MIVDAKTQTTPETLYPRLVELRRHFHQHPELAYEEIQTAQRIMNELDQLGISYTYGGKGTAVVGCLTGDQNGPTIALRAEMDGLPCAESTGLPFASDVPDTMHACGHDVHMAMLLGGAALLKASPPLGSILFVFQPAEESGNGACAVLDDPALDGAEAIFAGHVTHHHSLGEIMVLPGTITAQANRFSISVRGKGGHGARPHEAVDAVVVTSLLITTLQTLVSREINPLHPSVVTIGSVQAGTAHNVIAEHASLEGTIRTTHPEAQKRIVDGLERMVRAVGDMHNAQITIKFGECCPPVINAERETRVARRAAERVVGTEGIVEQEHPSMGAEDFSFYLDRMPGCYVRFGARGVDDEYVPLHSPRFTVDETVLKIGAAFFEQVAREAVTDRR